MPEFLDTRGDAISVLLWILFVVVSVLWAVVVYLLKRFFENADKRFNSHSQKHDHFQKNIEEVNVRMAETLKKSDLSDAYDWTSNELNKIKEQEIMPLREGLDDARRAASNELKQFESKITNSLSSLRSEIREDTKLIIGLLRKNGD